MLRSASVVFRSQSPRTVARTVRRVIFHGALIVTRDADEEFRGSHSIGKEPNRRSVADEYSITQEMVGGCGRGGDPPTLTLAPAMSVVAGWLFTIRLRRASRAASAVAIRAKLAIWPTAPWPLNRRNTPEYCTTSEGFHFSYGATSNTTPRPSGPPPAVVP